MYDNKQTSLQQRTTDISLKDSISTTINCQRVHETDQ